MNIRTSFVVVVAALLWSAAIHSEDQPQPNTVPSTEPVKLPVRVTHLEDQSKPGRFMTCVQIWFGQLKSNLVVKSSWIEVIEGSSVLARHRAVCSNDQNQTVLTAFFPGKQWDLRFAVGVDLLDTTTKEVTRIHVGRNLQPEEQNATLELRLIPFIESPPVPPPHQTVPPKVPDPPGRKPTRPPHHQIGSDRLQVLAA